MKITKLAKDALIICNARADVRVYLGRLSRMSESDAKISLASTFQRYLNGDRVATQSLCLLADAAGTPGHFGKLRKLS
tara:strand:+ start:10988 stop:11221 length:234 start_codon:yes stop_codon:yes gene_type:complete